MASVTSIQYLCLYCSFIILLLNQSTLSKGSKRKKAISSCSLVEFWSDGDDIKTCGINFVQGLEWCSAGGKYDNEEAMITKNCDQSFNCMKQFLKNKKCEGYENEENELEIYFQELVNLAMEMIVGNNPTNWTFVLNRPSPVHFTPSSYRLRNKKARNVSARCRHGWVICRIPPTPTTPTTTTTTVASYYYSGASSTKGLSESGGKKNTRHSGTEPDDDDDLLQSPDLTSRPSYGNRDKNDAWTTVPPFPFRLTIKSTAGDALFNAFFLSLISVLVTFFLIL